MSIVGTLILKAGQEVLKSVLTSSAENGLKNGARKAFEQVKKSARRQEMVVFEDPAYRFQSPGKVELQDMQGEVIGQYATVHIKPGPATPGQPATLEQRQRTLQLTNNASVALLQRHEVFGESNNVRDLSYINFVGMLVGASDAVRDSQSPATILRAKDEKQEKAFAGRIVKLESERYGSAVTKMSLPPHSPHADVQAARALNLRDEQRHRFLGSAPALLPTGIDNPDGFFDRSLRRMARLFGQTTPRDVYAAAEKSIVPIVGPAGKPVPMIGLKIRDDKGRTALVRVSQPTVRDHLDYFEAVARREPLTKSENRARGHMVEALTLFTAHAQTNAIARHKTFKSAMPVAALK